jgi:hypothetical protein
MVALKVYVSAVVGMALFGWLASASIIVFHPRHVSYPLEVELYAALLAAGAVVGALAATSQAIYAATRSLGRPTEATRS